MSAVSQVYLRDFLPSLKLPPLFMVEKCEVEKYIEVSEVLSATYNGRTYYRYPRLFGESSILSNVWFEKNILDKVTNHYLYCLETFLDNQCDDERGLDECLANPNTSEYIVSNIKSPLAMFPLSPFVAELR